MANEILDITKERMQKTIAVLKSELGGLRAGRANPQLLDRIMVDYYGTRPRFSNSATFPHRNREC
jgi:ribosome recycling factor